MKKYKIIYEEKSIAHGSTSRLIRIVKNEKGQRFRIRVNVPVGTSNDVEGHYWNGKEWAFVCYRYDIGHQSISVYEQTPKLEYLMTQAYDKVIKFIDCLED